MIVRGLSLKFGRYMTIASAVLLAVKNVELPLVNDKGKDSICGETEYVLIKYLSRNLSKNLCKYLNRYLNKYLNKNLNENFKIIHQQIE